MVMVRYSLELKYMHILTTSDPYTQQQIYKPHTLCNSTMTTSKPTNPINIYAPNPASNYRFIVKLQDGRSLVSCHADNAVLVADEAGDVVSCIEAEFARPEGIAVNSEGSVFIVDRHNRCIHVFDKDLTQQRTITTDFQSCGQLNQPVGIAIGSSDDRIWVADNENHRILLLNSKGEYISTLGNGLGPLPGQLNCPCGIALYTHHLHGELVIVSEWGGGRVQVFKANGDLFSIFGGVAQAHHVAVDEDGVVYVSEYATRRVKRFSLDGDWRDEWGASAVSLVAEKHGGGLAMVVTQKQVIRMDEDEDDECHKRKRDAE